MTDPLIDTIPTIPLTDKEIKSNLKDAGLYLMDASKRWPNHIGPAFNSMAGASYCLGVIAAELARRHHETPPLYRATNSEGSLTE